MATWKEKGVVPDSDDEDGLDSQSTAGLEGADNEAPFDDVSKTEVDAGIAYEPDGRGESSNTDRLALEAVLEEPDATAEQDLLQLSTPEEILDHFYEQLVQVQDGAEVSAPISSPPKVFENPLPDRNLDEDDAFQSRDDVPFSRPGSAVPAEDEISRSYVQITSPISSGLSSPPSSELSLPPHRNSNTRRSPSMSPSPQPILPANAQHLTGNGQFEPVQDQPASTARRLLRQRNAIQLHPYIVEQEKYRKVMKAGGIAPMRLASSQGETGRRHEHSSSPNIESQELDSQDTVFGEGEIQQDMDWNPPSSSPVRLAAETSQGGEAMTDAPFRDDNNDEDEDEDEEFPTLNELLTGPPRPKKHVRKHRLKTYGTKFRLQTQSAASAMKIFDIPPSPPATSSPFTATSRRGRAPLPRAESTPKEPTPSAALDQGPDPQPDDLPTPATSAVKPVHILIDSDIEENNGPIAFDVQSSLSPSSSSDESEKIRRKSRKIRGVLPASYLRLDQKKPSTSTIHAHRQHNITSPVKDAARRGVAIPRIRPGSQTLPILAVARSALFSDSGDSEEGDENESYNSVTEDYPTDFENLFDQSRRGFAQEDDRVDAMLPSKKRTSTISYGPRKKRASGSGVGQHTGTGSHSEQSRITDHLTVPRHHDSASTFIRQSKPTQRKSRRNGKGLSRPRKYTAPKLSILDVVDDIGKGNSGLPQFIRVAARTARGRVGQGRQDPFTKSIRLDNREDTQEVQSVLQQWKQGRIPQKALEPHPSITAGLQRRVLHEVTVNGRATIPPANGRNEQRPNTHGSSSKRKLVVSRRQPSMNDYLTNKQVAPRAAIRSRRHSTNSGHANRASNGHHSARPAQLESTEIPYSDRFNASSFKSRKRTLDTLYRHTIRRRVPQANFQLNRFLADDDIVRPSVETVSDANISEASDGEVDVVQLPTKPNRRRKQTPQRLDAGAADYRQPADPLILDFFTPVDGRNVANDNSKLLGLGKFGTIYPYHFDILPLQPGIFFHEKTLIGSRRLSEALHGKNSNCSTQSGSQFPSLKFADKVFTWTKWDENVSSEVGVLFDWLLDQFQVQQVSSPSTADANEVVAFVLDYVQHTASFDGGLDRDDFVARMVEVLRDFSNRVNVKTAFQQAQARRNIEVLSTCNLIVLHLLNTTRAQPVPDTSSYDVEDLLKSTASHCIELLLAQGLEPIRKLYDDLQYLSFRERGIGGEQYVANAWVTLVKILGAAEISRGSFWDLANAHLLHFPIEGVIDAPAMEKLWYSMYTLLPLCEFDEYGVVVPGLRQSSKFDNWFLPQHLLKQVFSLYKSNQRQPPGFNDYCRALFHRCHYLMTQWGWWKCSPIIGALFDFFTSHDLANLRNEEVYASPQFLEQLDTEPSLEIEAEDRCFHILLKIIALGIQHLSKTGDFKGIRNLVARLLPNHDRQYPKEEPIHHRELSALRNHHDLLCTLFWASPPDQRRPLSLIQELVIAERSHNEACLINIRAWENLTRFIVTKTMDREAYKPFALWQSAFFSGLYQQYLDAEKDVRKQAEQVEKRGQAMSESTIADTILANRRSIMVPICRSITAMGNAIKAAKSSIMAREAFNCELLPKALDPAVHFDGTLSKPLLSDCITSLCNYMNQIKLFHPPAKLDSTVALNNESESQDSLDMLGDWERVEMVLPLRHKILDKLCALTRRYMESEIDGGQDEALMTRLVSCWARIVSLVSEEGGIPLNSFLARSQFAIFENRRTCKVADLYWPLFLASLLKNGKTLSDFQLPGFAIGSEWLLSLIKCQAITEPARSLTMELQKSGYFLTKTIDARNLSQIQMMRAVIRKMSSTLMDDVTDAEVGLPLKQAQRLFSDMLGVVTSSMQRLLESLTPGSNLHNYHLQVARVVISDIRSYASDFSTVPDFFLKESAHYWPHYDDPAMYGAGLISYCLRLARQPDKTTMGLFYYLTNGWKTSLVSNRMRGYIGCIRKGMKRWEFTKFMLADLIPALITTGFRFSGWLMCSAFLPAISNQVVLLLENADSKSEWVFEKLLNILKMIMNSTSILAQRHDGNFTGVHPCHRGILAVTFKFWFAVALPMRQYATRHSQEAALEEVSDAFSTFVYNAIHSFHVGSSHISLPAGQFDEHPAKHTDKFVAALAQEIRDSWEFKDPEGFSVVVRGRANECSAVQMYGETLKQVLEVDLEVYEAVFPDKQGRVLPARRNGFLENLYL